MPRRARGALGPLAARKARERRIRATILRAHFPSVPGATDLAVAGREYSPATFTHPREPRHGSRPQAATAPSASRPATRSSPPPTRHPATAARPSRRSTIAADVRTHMAEVKSGGGDLLAGGGVKVVFLSVAGVAESVSENTNYLRNPGLGRAVSLDVSRS
jgi:hypothetical protein